ncbi:amino acid adenylation domain-containing protein [Rhodobacterales bacterium HKCCE3408]|nr:amino acid adenylation domain-containing protein [Rhodobacterales bacterium HKCCE3408]
MILGDVEGAEEILPLAPPQAGMLLDILRGDAPPGSYFGCLRFTLDGQVDTDRLIEAIRGAAASRDAFGLSFEWQGLSRPVQLLRVPPPLEVLVEDGPDDAAAIEARAAAEAARGFDLRSAPLSRVVILRNGRETHTVLWFVHHLICDGWSGGVLIGDVLARYGGEAPPAPGQFRDLLAWHAERPEADRAAEEAWWRDHLDGMEPPVRPGIVPATGPASGSVVMRVLPVDPGLDRAVNTLARRLRVTPATVVTALFAAQMRRYGVGDDIVIGQSHAGRPVDLPGCDTAVGAFVNTLPLRIRIDPEETVEALIRRAGAETEARRPHVMASLADVKAWAGLGASPAYHVPFIYEGLPPTPTPPQGIVLRDVVAGAPSPDPLAVLYFPGSAPSLRVYSGPAHHDPEVAAAFAGDFLSLLARAVADPDLPVAALSRGGIAAPSAEPAARLDFPPIPQAIARHAARNPEATAIRCGDERLSYAELLRAAEGIAAALADAGVWPGDIVPVAMGRSAAAVSGILGVMLCGAAYVALDLDYPRDRLAAMIEASGARVVVTRSEDFAALDWCDLPKVLPGTGAAPPVEITGDMAAYVLFTSGSQGQPKGVRVTHANLAWSTGIRTEVYGGDPDAFLVLSPLSFDSSVAGLYWALSTGGSVLLSPPGAEKDTAAVSDLIATGRPSHMLCLPRLYQFLLEHAPGERLASLDTVIVAGEVLPAALVELHRSSGPGRLFNEYGPTEATVWCTAYDTARHDGSADVPIGRAVPGAGIAITDPDCAVLPDGVLGEITVTGPGVADGYINAPAAAARVFTGLDGVPAYRTGDLGLRRPDGTVLYRGRGDAQVKIRGHRVELAEVEAALAAIPGIDASAVLARGGEAGQRLVAYAERGESRAIRDQLKQALPAYMVPSEIRVAGPLPRLPNGKIDRRSLEAIRPALPAAAEASEPTGFVATRLAAIWAELLGGPAVGMDDDFFDLGGDSLLAMRAVFAAEAAGLPIAAHEIFRHPVLSDLAAHIEAKAAAGASSPDDALLARLNAEGRETPFLMIHGSPEMCAHLGHALGPNRPLVFQYSRFLRGPTPWDQDLDRMADDLKTLADDLFGDGPVQIGGYSLGGVLAIEVARRIREERGTDPFVFLLDPSWETGASRLGPLPMTSLRARSVLLARLSDMRRRLGLGDPERQRLMSVGNCYRAKLLDYRPNRYDGTVRLLMSKEGRTLLSPESWLPAVCPDRIDGSLDVRHLDLQKDRDALFEWTTLLARMLSEAEEA